MKGQAPGAAQAPANPSRARVTGVAPAPRKRLVILFKFESASLSAATKFELDREIVNRLKHFSRVDFIRLEGHSDEIGSAAYNLKLSSRRAEAVQAYLALRGMVATKIVTHGYGSTQPIQRCADGDRAALIACLAPNRRVVVEVFGASGK